MTNEIGIRDQYSRGFVVGAEFAHRLARLKEHGFVVFKSAQRTDNGIETFPIAAPPSGAAVNDQSVRCFRDFRIEIVHQHAQGRFLVPAFATALCPAWRVNCPFRTHSFSCSLSNFPARIAVAIAAMSGARARSSRSGSAYFRTVA